MSKSHHTRMIWIQKQNLWSPKRQNFHFHKVLRFGKYGMTVGELGAEPWWKPGRWVYFAKVRRSVTVRFLWFYFGWVDNSDDGECQCDGDSAGSIENVLTYDQE